MKLLYFVTALAALYFVGLYIYTKLNPPLVNSVHTSKKTILQQMNEPRPLPMGQKEFVEWSDRIISGALVPTDDKESLVAILASMLMQLGPTESHKPDAFFIHSLRKAATNEVAHANFSQIKKRKEEAKKEAEKKSTHIQAIDDDKIIRDARASNLNPARS